MVHCKRFHRGHDVKLYLLSSVIEVLLYECVERTMPEGRCAHWLPDWQRIN